MIRALFYLFVFILGLGFAALWQGQMHHLRYVLPGFLPTALPAWTDQIEDSARLRGGEMVIKEGALHPELTLRWTAIAPNTEGLQWMLSLTGQGVDVSADLLVPFWPDRAFLRNGRGTMLLNDLVAGSGVGGAVRINRATGRLDGLLDHPQPSGGLTATVQRITLDGARLGEGPLRIELSADGGLSGTIALRDGLTDIDGTLSASPGAAMGQLDVAVKDVTTLPAAARGALERIGEVNGNALRLSLPLPVPF